MNLYRGTIKTDAVVSKLQAEIDKNTKVDEVDLKAVQSLMKAFNGIVGTFIVDPMGEGYALVGWPDFEEEKIKDAFYVIEQDEKIGKYKNDRAGFDKAWADATWEPCGAVTFAYEQVVDVEILKPCKHQGDEHEKNSDVC